LEIPDNFQVGQFFLQNLEAKKRIFEKHFEILVALDLLPMTPFL